MSRRPIYRWKSFWLGVVVLCFLGWAWARSMTWRDEVIWQRATEGSGTGAVDGDSVSAWQERGTVGVQWDNWNPFSDDGVSYSRRTIQDILGLADSETVWVKMGEVNEATGEMTYTEVSPIMVMFPTALVMKEDRVLVAHWVLCAVFVVVWGSWLGWRWRRERRASLTEVEIGMETEVSR